MHSLRYYILSLSKVDLSRLSLWCAPPPPCVETTIVQDFTTTIHSSLIKSVQDTSIVDAVGMSKKLRL